MHLLDPGKEALHVGVRLLACSLRVKQRARSARRRFPPAQDSEQAAGELEAGAASRPAEALVVRELAHDFAGQGLHQAQDRHHRAAPPLIHNDRGEVEEHAAAAAARTVGWEGSTAGLSRAARRLHATMSGEPATLDQLVSRAGLAVGEVAGLIRELERAGRVERARGLLWPC